jgi:hypothetical protein
MNHLLVLGFLLLGVLVLAFFGFHRKGEGFQSANQILRCPPGYTFFNSPDGTSMCCKGSVNPYTHQCISEPVRNYLCTFSANIKDPRPEFKGQMIPECRQVTTSITSGPSSTYVCPPSLPNYAIESDEKERCCKNPVQLYGETGFTCSTEDLADTARYCIAKGTPGPQEKMCDEINTVDTAVCPKDSTGKSVFQTVNYVMGDREAARYNKGDLKGLTIPTCYRLNETCIPETAIAYAKRRDAFTEYDPATWEYSCAVWSKRNRGETIPGEVKGYLT